MVWIKKFYNDPRDYLVKTHEVYIPEIEIETAPPEYDLDKQYSVVLCRDVDEITGEVSYLFVEESKDKIVSPKFKTQEAAMQWLNTAERGITK